MKHNGFWVGFSFTICSFNGNNHWIKLIFIYWLVITHAIDSSCQWWSSMMIMNKWYLWTLLPKVGSMENAPLCINSNIQTTCSGVWMRMVKGIFNPWSSFCQKKTLCGLSTTHIWTLSYHCCAASKFPFSFCSHNIEWISCSNDHLLKPWFQELVHWTTLSSGLVSKPISNLSSTHSLRYLKIHGVWRDLHEIDLDPVLHGWCATFRCAVHVVPCNLYNIWKFQQPLRWKFCNRTTFFYFQCNGSCR